MPWVPVSWLETTMRSPARSGVTMFWSQGVTNGTLHRPVPEARVDAEDLAVDLDDDLLLPGERRDDGRGVARPVAFERPLLLAGRGIERDQRAAVVAAGVHDQQAVRRPAATSRSRTEAPWP